MHACAMNAFRLLGGDGSDGVDVVSMCVKGAHVQRARRFVLLC